jgi:hypothetical protein
MFYDGSGDYCDCIPGRAWESPSRCTTCGTCRDKSGKQCGCDAAKCGDSCDAPGCTAVVTQKRIWNQVRARSSLYTMTLGALTVSGGARNRPPERWNCVNWNQMSDRAVPHEGTAYVPSRGSSTRGSVVRHRPGAGGFAGDGVDVKHGSYARYMARLKARSLRTERSSCDGKGGGTKPIAGNKRRMIGIVATGGRCCPPGPRCGAAARQH